MRILHRTKRTQRVERLGASRFGCPECGTEVTSVRGEEGALCRSCFKLWRVVRCASCNREGLLQPMARSYRCHGCGEVGMVGVGRQPQRRHADAS